MCISGSSSRALAAAAHECWCDELQGEGWTWSSRYDKLQQTHDALRPFEDLSTEEQNTLVAAVEAAGIREPAINAAQWVHDRSTGMPPRLSEMQVGLPVTSVDGSRTGVVESWQADSSRTRLESISVRWSDGSASTHTPMERELLVNRPS